VRNMNTAGRVVSSTKTAIHKAGHVYSDFILIIDYLINRLIDLGKSSESVQCAMLKACDACADMGQL